MTKATWYQEYYYTSTECVFSLIISCKLTHIYRCKWYGTNNVTINKITWAIWRYGSLLSLSVDELLKKRIWNGTWKMLTYYDDRRFMNASKNSNRYTWNLNCTNKRNVNGHVAWTCLCKKLMNFAKAPVVQRRFKIIMLDAILMTVFQIIRPSIVIIAIVKIWLNFHFERITGFSKQSLLIHSYIALR